MNCGELYQQSLLEEWMNCRELYQQSLLEEWMNCGQPQVWTFGFSLALIVEALQVVMVCSYVPPTF